MPLVDISLSAGRTPAQIRALIEQVHQAVHNTVDAKHAHITVLVREVPREHWSTGDVTLAELDAERQAPARPNCTAAISKTEESR